MTKRKFRQVIGLGITLDFITGWAAGVTVADPTIVIPQDCAHFKVSIKSEQNQGESGQRIYI